MDGVIFDIKEFSIHDGPGARITVFLKGCPLRCKWCHNPEGLDPHPQLLYSQNTCSHCGTCYRSCDHPECVPFGRCIHACPNGCLRVSGRTVSADELAGKLLENADVLTLTGGGITISGGEPMLQSDFVCALADKLPGVHKALQTSGYTDPDTYKRVVSRFDYIMQDIKLADDHQHRAFTGVSNERILNNVKYLIQSGKQFVFRVPLIPGITDTEENLRGISEIVGEHPVELLKYNALAGAKYEMLGMTYGLDTTGNRAEDFTRFFQNARME